MVRITVEIEVSKLFIKKKEYVSVYLQILITQTNVKSETYFIFAKYVSQEIYSINSTIYLNNIQNSEKISNRFSSVFCIPCESVA